MRERIALALVVAVAGLALAAGCGGGDEGDEGQTAGAATEATTAEAAATMEEATTAETAATTEAATGEGDAQAGEQVFASAGCSNCHTLAAAGATGQVGPNLDELQPSVDQVVEQVTNGGGGMPAFDETLTDEQIRAVAAFVAEATSGGADDGSSGSGSGGYG